MWGRKRVANKIRELESRPPEGELDEAKSARASAQIINELITSREPEVTRLNQELRRIREKNNFAKYWRDALIGDG